MRSGHHNHDNEEDDHNYDHHHYHDYRTENNHVDYNDEHLDNDNAWLYKQNSLQLQP